MSICSDLQNKGHVIEALYMAKFKFSDHQKAHLSKCGSSKFNADESEDVVVEKLLIPKGCQDKYVTSCGPGTSAGLLPVAPSIVMNDESHFLTKLGLLS